MMESSCSHREYRNAIDIACNIFVHETNLLSTDVFIRLYISQASHGRHA